jgi:hypothetical protein
MGAGEEKKNREPMPLFKETGRQSAIFPSAIFPEFLESETTKPPGLITGFDLRHVDISGK